jgi:hypothetical protein
MFDHHYITCSSLYIVYGLKRKIQPEYDSSLSVNYIEVGKFTKCVNQLWILKICKSMYNLHPSPPAIALQHLTSLPSTQVFTTIEKRCTICTHGYADFLLKNTSTKHSKYVVNQKHEHVDDTSFR